METDDERGGARDGGTSSRLLRVLPFVTLAAGFVLNLTRARWLTAAFFGAVALTLWKGREFDRWPRAARYLIVLLLAGLTVGVFVQLILEARAVR